MTSNEKEVYFNQYCPVCKYNDKLDEDGFLLEVCETCLSMPSNMDSHKPVNYEEVEK